MVARLGTGSYAYSLVNIYRVKPGSKRDFTKSILAVFTEFGIESGAGERGTVRAGLSSMGLRS